MSYTISIHTRHDANMTISSKDAIISYFEFEKLTKVRNFEFSKDEKFGTEFYTYIMPILEPYRNQIVKFNFCWLTMAQKELFIQEFPEIIFEEKNIIFRMHIHSMLLQKIKKAI